MAANEANSDNQWRCLAKKYNNPAVLKVANGG